MESLSIKTQQTPTTSYIDLYNEATEDYEFWSPNFNMHFGYFKLFKTNPFKREQLLTEMNRQIFKRLQPQTNNHFIDMGCGMGGAINYGTNHYSNLKITGVTLSDFQVKEGNQRLNPNGRIEKQDYNNTNFNNDSADGVYAIESYCHSGHSIQSFKEAFRVLKKGKRLVIADAFLKKTSNQLCKGANYCYQELCTSWDLQALGSIQQVKSELTTIGFSKVSVEDVSYKVAPSVLHVPFAIGGFILNKLLHKEALKPQTLNNLKGSFYSLACGLHLNEFGYYIITAEK